MFPDASELIIPILATLIPVSVGSVFAGYIHLWIRTATNATKVESLQAASDAYNLGVKEFISAKFEGVGSRFDAQDYRLERIERSLNGHLVKD